MRMEEISLSRSVSLVGFDLKKTADVPRVEPLIDAAAERNCKQLDSLYLLIPSDARPRQVRACVPIKPNIRCVSK